MVMAASDEKEKVGGDEDVQIVNCNIFSLTVYLCCATAVLSAFLDNVTTMLLLAPVTIKICNVLEVDAVPLLISEVLFSNIGGTATMIGDPPNIIIGNQLQEDVDFVDFLTNIAPCIVICIPFCVVLLKLLYAEKLQGDREVDIAMLKRKARTQFLA